MKRSTPLRRKAPLSSIPKLRMSVRKDDILLFRVGRCWLGGDVERVLPRHVLMRSAFPPYERHTVKLAARALKAPHAQEMGAIEVALKERAYRDAVMPKLSGPLVIRAGGQSQPVSVRRERYRDGEYLDFIRAMPCIGCPALPPLDPHHDNVDGGVALKDDDTDSVPLCRACHKVLHATGHLPGLTSEATQELLRDTKVQCLKNWFHLQKQAAAAEAEAAFASALTSGLPRLAALCGAFLLALLFSGAAWATPPTSADLLLARGRVQLHLGKAQVAELLARRALAQQHFPALRAHLLLADALLAQGRCSAARPEYLRAYEVAPGDPDVLVGIERCAGDAPRPVRQPPAPPLAPLDHPPAMAPVARPVAQGARP